ncbi:uncharacterized protein LOC108100020 [Drosophila ficusphila]|uniref:uncharacterized protein LOC108100020 n=1 Tax=Drosophila ficusphila TaxID=30025 RepID=UPI0007E6BE84|nr:uncharacterized protein LOC108100020 [Drosophila ficusphila]
MKTSPTTALGLVIFLPLALMQQDTRTANWAAQIDLELQEQPDKLAFCRILQQNQNLRTSLRNSECASVLNNQLGMTGELLLETLPRCWSGWELFGRRCRKLA